eukprot:TRINITY_DN30411_c0_g3_i2.p1 TRINITY_DN30411_c0_g3~~TRINITY_DN30411_c0_g3_i2.p1  ORF type:complete len:221 (-),score=28.94 TRINITY_DN30411_c0_g3_i2:85-747(-)
MVDLVFSDWLHCCCATTGVRQDVPGSTIYEQVLGDDLSAAKPLESTPPRLGQRRPVATPVSGDAPGSGIESARSMGSSAMTPEEKESEKARLQRLVKDFAREAIVGIAVNVVQPETGAAAPYYFQMDRFLTVFSLKPRDGSTNGPAVQDYNVRDLTSIYKGAEVAARAPSLGGLATSCIGLDTNRADRKLFFYFEDDNEREKIYTCLKILRMSVDVGRDD